jgi:hypothetical protein
LNNQTVALVGERDKSDCPDDDQKNDRKNRNGAAQERFGGQEFLVSGLCQQTGGAGQSISLQFGRAPHLRKDLPCRRAARVRFCHVSVPEALILLMTNPARRTSESRSMNHC